MKIYNRKDFIFGIIMCLALPGRLMDGIQQWNDGEVGGLLWVAAVLAIAGRYFYNACNKTYNETDTAAKALAQEIRNSQALKEMQPEWEQFRLENA